jgi:hypothetical protein
MRNGGSLSVRQGIKATMLPKPGHTENSRWEKKKKKAWMTSQIREEWLKAFNGRMNIKNWYVLLFLDNATCHPHIKFSNVRLAWFPSNTTSVSQPMDQGIIRNVKVHYRKLLMQSLLANMDCTSSSCELARTVWVLGEVIWISQAVKLLPETATRCFEKAGFLRVRLLLV